MNFLIDQDPGTKIFVRNIDTGLIEAIGGAITSFLFIEPGDPGSIDPEDPRLPTDPLAHRHYGFVGSTGAFYYIGHTVDEDLNPLETAVSLQRFFSIDQFLSVVGNGFGAPEFYGRPFIQVGFGFSGGFSIADLTKGTLSDLGLAGDASEQDEPTPSGLIIGATFTQSGAGQPLIVSGTDAPDHIVATTASDSVVASLGGGNDTLKSGSGADSVLGGAGNDTI